MNHPRALPVAFVILLAASAGADELDDLARDFWAWRAVHQPLSQDDMTRIERAPGWLPDWSKEAVAARRRALEAFEGRFKSLDASGWPVPRQVDRELMGSALERVRWELDVTRGWRRNAMFYVDQTMGAAFDRLLQPPPFDAVRSRDVVARVASIPRTVAQAKANLDEARAPFARLALAELKDAGPRLQAVARGLKPLLAKESAAGLDAATGKAIVALESYRAWLEERLPKMPDDSAVGRDGYVFFLKNVALMPFTPEQLLEMGRQEWDRALAFEELERHRNEGLPELPLFPDEAAQVARQEKDEAAVRRFQEERGVLTIPDWLKHYTVRPLPAYLAPLTSLGVTDDLTSPDRLDQDGVSYIRPPSPDLGYFELANAKDPRTGIVHEGMHYFQLAMSWRNPDPIRRHYYDSGPSEGIAFYDEEMMLQAGLFDDSPRTREIVYNMMRLRALRVEVDVKLALGMFTIDQGAEYLRTRVPMDAETARWEAAFFASTPGQAITYQIGKLQILRFLSEARLAQGEKFSLRAFHDFLWTNGNVPIALQEREFLERAR